MPAHVNGSLSAIGVTRKNGQVTHLLAIGLEPVFDKLKLVLQAAVLDLSAPRAINESSPLGDCRGPAGGERCL
jgi:hypothetical protein